MAVRSQYNNRLSPLAAFGRPNDQFIGTAEATTGANALNVAIYTDQLTFLYVEQSPDRGNWYIHEQYSIQPNTQYNIQVPCVLGWFRITITNQGGSDQTTMSMITSLIQAFKPKETQGVTGTVLIEGRDIYTNTDAPISATVVDNNGVLSNMLGTFSIASVGANEKSSITAYGKDSTGSTAVYSPIPLTGNLAEEATSVLISGKTLCQGINDSTGNPTIVNVKDPGAYSGQTALRTTTQAFYKSGDVPDYSTPDSTVGVYGSQWNLDAAGQTQSLCVSERKNDGTYGAYVDLLVNDKDLNAKIISCDTSSIGGTVNVILPNTIYNTTFATITGPATGDSIDIGATGLVSVVISADSVTGDFPCGIQYSLDGTIWIDSESGTLTTSALAFGVTGLFIGAPLVRLYVPSATTETATNLKFSLFGKAL